MTANIQIQPETLKTNRRSKTGKYQLSDREMEVLSCLAEGDMLKSIGARLFISIETVKRHLSNIYTKLGVRSGKEAIRKAYIEGLV